MLANNQLTQEIDDLIEEGDLNSAKNNLHDLLNNNPNNLDIRTKLGQVYWGLGDAEAAGRYWFLIEANSPEMVAATFEFVTSCNNDPLEILRRIEFNGEIGELQSEFAKYMLVNLQSEATKPEALASQFAKNQAELDELILPLNYEKRSPVRRTLLWAGCITALALPIILLVLTMFGIGRWVTGLF